MRKVMFRFRGETLELSLKPEGGGWKIVLPDGAEHHVLHAEVNTPYLTLTLPTGRVQLAYAQFTHGIEIQYRGRTYRFQSAAQARSEEIQHSSAEGVLTAPMPGLITKVFVQEGDAVEAGQRLLTLEAMKTEQTLRAPFAGTVARLLVREGELVQENAVLVEVQPRSNN